MPPVSSLLPAELVRLNASPADKDAAIREAALLLAAAGYIDQSLLASPYRCWS